MVVDDEDGGGHARNRGRRAGGPQYGQPHSCCATKCSDISRRRMRNQQRSLEASAHCEEGHGEIGPTAAYSRDEPDHRDVSAHDRILAERARYVSAGVSTPRLVVSHADGARVTDVDGRTLHRLRRWHRLPEHGPPLRPRRRRDQGAGRRVPAPVLHGRRLRALRRGVPPAGRALAVRRRASRSRSSSTRAPRRSRTPSRSRARRPAGPPSSSSTTPSTAARC